MPASTRTLVQIVLPAWVPWANAAWVPLLAFAATAAAAWCAARVASWLAGPLPAGPWAARARITYAIRAAVGSTSAMLVFAFAGLAPAVHGPVSALPVGVLPWLAAIAALHGGCLIACREAARLGIPAATGVKWWQEMPAYLLLLQPACVLVPLVLTVALSAPPAAALVVLVASIVALMWLSAGGGLRVLARAGMARPASARLAAVAHGVAARVGVTLREVAEVDVGMANALAYPLGRRIAVTTAALAAVDDAELTGLCAHEVGHLAEPRHALLARLLPTPLALTAAASPALVQLVGPWPIGGAVVGFLAIGHVGRRIFRRMEARADAVGHTHEPADGAYASALERLHEASGIPAVLRSARGPHAQLYDRLLAAGAVPSYPRPDPPPARPTRLGGLAALLVAAGLVAAIMLPVYRNAHAADASERAVLWHVALFGGAPRDLFSLAALARERGLTDRARTLEQVAKLLSLELRPAPAGAPRALRERRAHTPRGI